jgi:hypothetical protein
VVPALRDRYLKRAEYLLDDKRFLDSLHQTVRNWNRDYPDFQVSHSGEPPKGLG